PPLSERTHAMSNPLRIGTRGSALALWQANHVRDLLQNLTGSRPVELVEIQTTGDHLQDVSLAKIGGEGVFTKEIQRSWIDGRVARAGKGLRVRPALRLEGLSSALGPPGGPTGVVFVSPRHRRFDDLPQGAPVATSSLRRRAQVRHRRPDLNLVDIRGNVQTR